MHLFEDEVINITNIRTINMYQTIKEFEKGNINHYSTNLKSNELIFFLSGKRRTVFGDVVMDDVPNSIRFLPKINMGGKYFVEVLEEGLCIDIYFETDSPLPKKAMNLKNMNELKPLFEKAYNVWNRKRTGYYTECMSVFYEIIKKIKLHNEKYYTNEQTKKIFPSYEFLMENYTKADFDYKKMCECSGLSYDYFKDLFIKQYGVSPVKYVTMMRVEKAKELLLTKLYSVTEVAEMCGFENIYYFSNVFKKATGISPKNYI